MEASVLDIIGAIYGTAYVVAQAALLITFLPVRTGAKVALFAAAATWVAAVAGLYADGGPPPHLLGPVPVNLLPFAVYVTFLFATWLLVPGARDAVASMPLPALIAVHIGRIGGLLFILLFADGRLSAPFGPVAGGGDVITGALALVLVAMLAFGKRIRPRWIAGWNAFGAADLLVAVALAVLSAPGTTFRIFTDVPGTQIMGTLPWVFVPAILVPVDLLVHALIAARMSVSSRDADGRATAFAG
jgi:hypothetical protein